MRMVEYILHSYLNSFEGTKNSAYSPGTSASFYANDINPRPSKLALFLLVVTLSLLQVPADPTNLGLLRRTWKIRLALSPPLASSGPDAERWSICRRYAGVNRFCTQELTLPPSGSKVSPRYWFWLVDLPSGVFRKFHSVGSVQLDAGRWYSISATLILRFASASPLPPSGP
jgi:hypothetical protein